MPFSHLSKSYDVVRSVREELRVTLNPFEMEAIGAAVWQGAVPSVTDPTTPLCSNHSKARCWLRYCFHEILLS